MVCIYCGGKTTVTNSRPQKRLGRTWRRRECQVCGAVFTTIESADLSGSVMVRAKSGDLEAFSRDKLFLSIATALGHRNDASATAGALSDTTIALLQPQIMDGTLLSEQIRTVTLVVLERFDSVAGVQYGAYHPDKP